MAPPHVNEAANSASSPIYKILYIVEIVESVLRYVPERDLLANATRTCKVRIMAIVDSIEYRLTTSDLPRNHQYFTNNPKALVDDSRRNHMGLIQ